MRGGHRRMARRSIVTLLDAIREVMSDPDIRVRYPEGLDSGEVLAEVRTRFGDDAFPYVTVIDVADDLRSFYGAPR